MSTNDQIGKSVALAGAIDGKIHRLTARIYFADTDFSGAVYHARYLEFLERGRSDFLRLMGVHHTDLLAAEEGPLYWVVRRMEIDFRAAAGIDDIVEVQTLVSDIGGARLQLSQKLVRGADVLIEAEVVAALINKDGKPQRLAKSWKSTFGQYLTSQDD